MQKTIYLIRHTTPLIEAGICYGQTDLDVTDSFESELKRIRTVLPDLNDPIVYSSPLKRCLKLALGLNIKEPIVDQRVIEVTFGDWEMKPWEEVHRQNPAYWKNGFVEQAPPNGETFRQVYERASSFLDEILNNDKNEIVVVSHGGTIRTMLAHIIDLPLEKLFYIHLDFGSVSAIEKDERKTRVQFVNR